MTRGVWADAELARDGLVRVSLGEQQLIVFEESMREARAGKSQVSSAPVNLAKYSLVPRVEFEE